MPILTFDIPNKKAQRLSAALPSLGYVYDPSSALTDNQQRQKFVEKLTVNFWRDLVFNYERSVAIANEPNDSAALQSARFVGLDDVTSSTTN
jgi:hypothetical protein